MTASTAIPEKSKKSEHYRQNAFTPELPEVQASRDLIFYSVTD
jgi:hypothetical protein